MTASEWVGTVLNVVQIVAIVVGAVWAYYKFVRGRTFARRAELSVAGEVLSSDATAAVRARVSLRNTGAAKIPLRAKALYVHAADQSEWRPPRVTWRKVAALKVLEPHGWLEAQETIADDVVVPLPTPESSEHPLVYRLECRVYEQRGGRRKGGIKWTAEAIVPAGLRPAESRNTAKGAPDEG